MANVIINDTNLTNIAAAIREKNGTETKYKPSEMAAAISAITGGGGTEFPDFELYGHCSEFFADDRFSWILNDYSDKIVADNITNASYMFARCERESIPNIEIKVVPETNEQAIALTHMFDSCYSLETLPLMTLIHKNYLHIDFAGMFKDCHNLNTIPDNFFNSGKHYAPYNYYLGNTCVGMFQNCFSLRKVPDIITGLTNRDYGGNWDYMFSDCATLDEITNLPVPTGGMSFNNTFNNCSRVKNITFQGGSNVITEWNNLTLDLSRVGYVMDLDGGASDNYNIIINYNSGITADKLVKDYNTYTALKDDPDWFTCEPMFSRYNKESAVKTINSLPKVINCAVKFRKGAGVGTTGGSVGSLTNEQIAVATAKGWTVAYV